MQFNLFSTDKLSFEAPDPIALIESYCIQSDFYTNFDLIPIEKRQPEHANKIGARIKKEIFSSDEFKKIMKEMENLKILKPDSELDKFLNLDEKERSSCIRDLNEKIIKKLLNVDGIGLSKATKILHALRPRIVPMIDNQLQDEYRRTIKEQWQEVDPQIFIDYYNNLKERANWENLNEIFRQVSERGFSLSKIRIFDIVWWSYLRARRLENVRLSSIKW